MDGENNGKPSEQMDDLGVPRTLGLVAFRHNVFAQTNLGFGKQKTALQE